MNPRRLKRALELSRETGGCVKFDLKAHGDHLHRALTGVTNRQTMANFRMAALAAAERHNPLWSSPTPCWFLDTWREEVYRIAQFTAEINLSIPYTLGFHPHCSVPDLPAASRRHAEEAVAAAYEAGLEHVRVGNRHLLSRAYWIARG